MVMVLTTIQDETAMPATALPEVSSLTPAAERRCLATGAVLPKPELIRFVVGPEQQVVPDLAARLPGRGLWVAARRDALRLAVQKKLFAKAAKASVIVDPELPQQVERLLARRCLELLGLARGAGLAITGQPQVEQAVKARELAFVLVSSDAGGDGPKKLHHAKLVPSGFTRDELGEALGREQLVYIGLRPHTLTEKLHTELTRWHGVREDSPLPIDATPDSEQP